MSDIIQKIIFPQSGLNSDDSNLFMPMGDSPYRLHASVSEDGLNGVLTFMKGNSQVDYIIDLTLSNTYMVLGSFYNTLTRKMYFFIFSQPYEVTTNVYQYDNRLLCLNEDTLTVDTIFLDTKNWFGLDPTQHLTDIRMIENWLFFNPVTDEPKMIDVEMAYNYTNYPAWDDTDASAYASQGDKYTWKGGLFVANTSVSANEDPSSATTKWDRIGNSYQAESTVALIGSEFERAFLAIKQPPLERILASVATDADTNFNNIRGKVWRFCHRYQYFDDSFSVCSSHSDIVLPNGDELYNGENTGGLTFNNYIQLQFSLYSPALIKNIEILAQEIGQDWRRIAIINRQAQDLLDTVTSTYNFYNNEFYPIVAQELPYKIQDAVPRYVASQEIINKNVLCYGGCTEGFDNIDKDLIDITLTPVISEFNVTPAVTTLRRDGYAEGDVTYIQGSYSAGTDYIIRIDIGSWHPGSGVVDGDQCEIQFGGVKTYFTITPAMEAGADALGDGMVAAIKASGWDKVDRYNDPASSYDTTVRIYMPYMYPQTVGILRYYLSSSTVTSLSKVTGFKTGAYHPFCLFYYDGALRRMDAQIIPDMSVYVPSLNEYSPPLTTTNHKWAIEWKVEHAPPEWAKYWRWGYAGNRRCSYFVQYIIESIADSTPTNEDTPEDVVNTVKIDLTPLQTIRTTTETYWNCFPNSTIPSYQFTEGDRIRFITESTNPTIAGTTFGDVIDGVYDFEILKFDETSMMAYVQGDVTDFPNIGVNSLVEIYTPQKDLSSIDNTKTLTYYEFGDLFRILEDADGNLVHEGATQNQSLTSSPLAAEGTFSKGDVYHILRTPSKPLCTASAPEYIVGAFHESMWWSDFYDSDDWDRGKLGLESPIGEVTLNIIRHSNVYLQNTAINGITTFDAVNVKELNDTFGNIISIVEVGDTLKCYQEKKPSSIQIGRTEYVDTEGRGNNVQTQAFILGSIRYSTTNYGTIFPESIVKNNRYVYGFDIYNGVLWRDSANGIFPISGRYADIGASQDYKMMSYFKTKSKALLTSGVAHCHVLTVWDEEYKMLYVVFKDTVDNANNETIVFHEPSDRWITFADFTYTPAGGWTEMIELTYDIVKGFENGLGYEFDEETRFAVFNIGSGVGTSNNIAFSPPTMPLRLTIPTPVVTCSADISPASMGIILTIPTPTIHISSVVATDLDMEWESGDSAWASALPLVFTIEGGTFAYLSSMPSWIYVYYEQNTNMGITDTVHSGDTLYISPNSANSGPRRTGSVIFTDNYNNTTVIAVEQAGSTTSPVVTVQVWPTSEELTLFAQSGTVATGSSDISITFTPDATPKQYNDEYSLYYQITKNSVVVTSGTITNVLDERENTKTISMLVAALADDVIVVDLAYRLVV